MSRRLDILGARIFGASVCDVRKYLQPFRKCPNVWTKSPILAIMHKHKSYIIRIKACICAFCYFINFLHIFLDIFTPFLFFCILFHICNYFCFLLLLFFSFLLTFYEIPTNFFVSFTKKMGESVLCIPLSPIWPSF